MKADHGELERRMYSTYSCINSWKMREDRASDILMW